MRFRQIWRGPLDSSGDPEWSQSWQGISTGRRLGYYSRMVFAAVGALLAGPTGAGLATSPIDPRRLRDRERAAEVDLSD
jgi:hypothetical protein